MWSDSLLPENYSYPRREPTESIEEAIKAFGKGEPVLIHDGDERENEVDLVYPAHAVTPSDVAQMRNDAGGLICVALSHHVAETFDLPFLHDVLDHPASRQTDIQYDNRPSFSLTVNHRETFTGIVDTDRAQTIATLGDAARAPGETDFAAEFDMPGHVHLLKAAPDLLESRQGHTELSIALAELAAVSPAVVVCEMLDDQTGGALSRSSAATYAGNNDYAFLSSTSIIEKFQGD